MARAPGTTTWRCPCAALAVGLLALSAAPRVARAEPPPSADALIEHGVELREQGHDDAALLEFQRAMALDPTPRARAQVALAEQALGHWTLAEEHLAEVLATSGDPWVEARRPVLVHAAAAIAQHLGSLDVTGGPPGAEVVVDGRVVGELPLVRPLRVETGPRLLEVRRPGYYPVLRTLVVAPDATARESVTLVPFPVGQAAPEPAAPPVAVPPPTTPTIQRTLAYTGFAVSGALVATAIVGMLERQSAVDGYNADPTCMGIGASQSSECSDRLSTVSTWRAVTIVSFVAAGVIAGGSVVLLATAPRAPSSRGVACFGGLGEVRCEGRF